MPLFSLQLKKLVMPNFGDNNSRKNFRLMFDITYLTEKEDIANSLVLLPASKDWQWRDDKDDFFIPVLDKNSDPVEFDLRVMDKNEGGFSKTDKEILLAKGKIIRVKVTILDVGDPNFGKALLYIAKHVLPSIIATGVGATTGIIGNKIIATLVSDLNKNDDLSSVLLNEFEKQFKEKSGDKVLFKGGEIYANAPSQINIAGTGKGRNKEHKGQYEIFLTA